MKVFTIITRQAGLFLVLGALSISLISCSSSRNEDSDTGFYDEDREKDYIFTENGVEWKVKMQDDEITELYKDGARVPDSDIHRYESRISRKIEKFEKDMEEFRANMNLFHEDMEAYNKEMAAMKEEMKRHQFIFDFDTGQFEKNMKQISADINAAFASAEFRESMKELQNNLKDIHVDINMDEVNAQLEAAKEQLKNINVNVDLSGLNKEMANLKEELKDLKIDLKEAKSSVRKFNIFMDDLKNELEDDGLINSADDDFEMIFNSKEIIIDGKKAPAELHAKYKKMYEEQFGKMDDEMNIKTRE
jgi:chromosome segregation ATPase